MPNNSLKIESADIRDAGVYICIAQNNAGTSLNQVRLEVQGCTAIYLFNFQAQLSHCQTKW